MLPASAMLFALATCLAGFDEILTLQRDASRTGRPFHLVHLATPEEEPLPYPVSPLQSLCLSERVVLASRPRFLFANRTRLPFAGAARPAAQKIEFMFSCQSHNLSTGASRACALVPSRLINALSVEVRPGRRPPVYRRPDRLERHQNSARVRDAARRSVGHRDAIPHLQKE